MSLATRQPGVHFIYLAILIHIEEGKSNDLATVKFIFICVYIYIFNGWLHVVGKAAHRLLVCVV